MSTGKAPCTANGHQANGDAAKADYAVAPWWYAEPVLKLKWADRAVLWRLHGKTSWR